MKVILILAGKSRRFWPLSEKPLFPICGKTLAEHQIDRLATAGFRDVILVVSPENRSALKKIFPKLKIIVQKGDQLGMHRALLPALPFCKKEPVLIVSGNDFIDPSAYGALKKTMERKEVDGAILAAKVKRYFPGGYLTVKAGRIAYIIEKPKPGKEPGNLVNIVAHLHRDASLLLKALRATLQSADDGYELALGGLLRSGNYRPVPYGGPWQAVKYPWHLLPLLETLLSGIQKPFIDKSASIHKTAIVEGNVVIGKNVRILPHASVVGPCFIGDGSVIGNNAFVRGSSIGAGCVVGYNSEIKGSILAGPVWTHMTYLGDSIIGRNVSFGACSTTGNLRLDEQEIFSAVGAPQQALGTGLTKLGMIVGDDCRFSVQVAGYPGIKVGAGTFVSDCAILKHDVPAGSFVNVKEGVMQIRPNKMRVPSMDERKKLSTRMWKK